MVGGGVPPTCGASAACLLDWIGPDRFLVLSHSQISTKEECIGKLAATLLET
jgi:sarcosine oxidase gamma subunit